MIVAFLLVPAVEAVKFPVLNRIGNSPCDVHLPFGISHDQLSEPPLSSVTVFADRKHGKSSSE
jgi:hypothetical protein